MVQEVTTKPQLLRQPAKWFTRQVRLKSHDLLKAAGMHAVERIDYRNYIGKDYAHVIDVGVADGTPDLCARFPKAFLDLVEPHPDYQKVIEAGVLARREGRLHKCALGAQKGTAQLHLKGRTGSSIVKEFGRGSIEVPVERLDELLSPDDLRRPCMLKVDTEGYEMHTLKGAEGLMDHIDCVAVEIHFEMETDYRLDEMIAYLAERGFRLTQILDNYIGRGRFLCGDFVFERQDER